MRIAPTHMPTCLPLPDRWVSGVASLDTALAGGLAHGHVHEIYAAEMQDITAAAGLIVAWATAIAGEGRGLVWLRTYRAARQGGVMQANGWAEMGGFPGAMLMTVAPDNKAMLRMAVEALRCPALGAVIVEGHGRMAELDLTVSRRLALAAEKSGVTAFVLRIDATPCPSAAQTRWQVTSAPSRALPGNAPGQPVFDVELLRQRSGPSGLRWRLEWDRDERIFRDAALSGAVVPVPVRRPAADTGAGPFSSVRRHAA